jgi:hypothetical protein
MSSSKVQVQCADCGNIMTTNREKVENNKKLYCESCLIYSNCIHCEKRLKLSREKIEAVGGEPVCLECDGRSKTNRSVKSAGDSPITSKLRSYTAWAITRWIGVFAALVIINIIIYGLSMVINDSLTGFEYVAVIGVTLLGCWIFYHIGNWGLTYDV